MPDPHSLETDPLGTCGVSQDICLSPGTLTRSCRAAQGPDQLVENQKQLVTVQQLAPELEGTVMNVSASVTLPDSLMATYCCLL